MAESPPPPSTEAYAIFVGDLNTTSAKNLASKLCLGTQGGTSKINIALQSIGGGPSEGIFLNNLIRNLSIPVATYNIGTVCSAAVMVFLGASQRIATENASFMIHRATTTQQNVGQEALAAGAASLALDDERSDQLLKAHLTLSKPQWKRYNDHHLWLNAAQALDCGLITEIGGFKPPVAARIYDFNLP